jgi:SAM-dependent methyltransferase
MNLEATEVQLSTKIEITSDETRSRYHENAQWRYYPKEWIYKNISLAGKDVLDFGCGTGEISTQAAFLGARRVYALDVTEGLLDCTDRRAELDGVSRQVETLCGSIQQVEPRPVDVIIAFAVLHHCFPLENVMPYLLRWLKPGGTFVAVEPVSYIESLEYLRTRSGVPFDPLDEGERKLNALDLDYVASHFERSEIVDFHVLNRLSRLVPAGDYLFRRLDRLILGLPFTSKLAGTALFVGEY